MEVASVQGWKKNSARAGLLQPVARMWQYTPVDCPVYVIDPEDTPIDGEESVIHIKEKATVGVARAIEKMIMAYRDSAV